MPPWGKSGDKATPSLIGDATAGVFLRQRRIFLGGQAGMVGPRVVGYGSMTGAGQVVRRDVNTGQLSIQVARALDQADHAVDKPFAGVRGHPHDQPV